MSQANNFESILVRVSFQDEIHLSVTTRICEVDQRPLRHRGHIKGELRTLQRVHTLVRDLSAGTNDRLGA
jgi:hypothetical protein